MTKLNFLDLEFLFNSVSVGLDYSKLANPLDPTGIREIQGTNNNLVGHEVFDNDPLTNNPGPNHLWGATDQPFTNLSAHTDRTGEALDGTKTSYSFSQNGTNVTDASPRLISNLVSTMYTDGTYANPAVQAVVDNGGGSVENDANKTAFIDNVGPLGAASFNSWFVFFGQFFDHGLDFIEKDGNAGFVFIQIVPGDPLYVDPSSPEYVEGRSNLMMVSRANLSNPDSDFIDDGNGNMVLDTSVTRPVFENKTGLQIDQSQTYGSHETINAFIHEYDAHGIPTGRLVTGKTEVLDNQDSTDDALATGVSTWADIKINAERIGVVLTDQDVFNAPLLRVDAKGDIQFQPDGTIWTTVQIVGFDPTNQDPSDPFVRDADGNVVKSEHGFLLDAHPAASPEFMGIARTADTDDVINEPRVPDMDPAGGFTYDNELLDAHYINGDGRVNENIALTAVHHIWHSEHNFQVDRVKEGALLSAIETGDVKHLNQWLTTPVTDLSSFAGLDVADSVAVQAAVDGLVWNGEYVFQAARMITETEYNHVAVDEYVGRLVADLAGFLSYDSTIQQTVSLEFSQAVFRLGHSMLTESLDMFNSDTGETSEMSLLEAFLNPTAYANTDVAHIVEGAMRQEANEVDEFVTPALQQSLLGRPLDLAAINIARGRDLGLPTWNEFRKQVFDGIVESETAGGSGLRPYESWADIEAHLRNPETVVNLIAAYAHDTITDNDWGINEARQDYYDGKATIQDLRAVAQNLVDAYHNGDAKAKAFMEGVPTYNQTTGSWEQDTTQVDQGFWDIDLWLGGLAERPLIDGMLGTTFSYVMLDFAQQLQDGDRFYYLYRMPVESGLGEEIISTKFSDIIARNTGTENLNGDSFAHADSYFIAGKENNDQFHIVNDGTQDHYYFDANYATLADGTRASDGHIVIAGGAGNDRLFAGNGDDTIHGGDGDDFLNGSQGNDHIFGGAGNDYIIDDENDDFIRGGTGDDIVYAGKGALDTVFGDEGNDELHGGEGADELFGGEGDDELYGDGDVDILSGDAGVDYLDGGASGDALDGGDGNDILRGRDGEDQMNGNGGNDLLMGDLGATAIEGDFYFGDDLPLRAGAIPLPTDGSGFGADPAGDMDVASYEFVNIAIKADLETSNQASTGSNLLDKYSFIEGMVGSTQDDELTGAGFGNTTSNGVHNMLIGGAGNDILKGLSGNDIIVGDWAVVGDDLKVTAADGSMHSQDKTSAIVDKFGLNRIDLGGDYLGHILGDNGVEGDQDVAVFSGNFADYTIAELADGWVEVKHDPAVVSPTLADGSENPAYDGTDLVRGIEILRFADGDKNMSDFVTPPIGNETLHYDIAGETQELNGTAENDVFVVDANSTDYGWNVTDDGSGIVVWNDTGFDILRDFEAIRFNDLDIPLTNNYFDIPEVNQFVYGTNNVDTFVVNGNSADYGVNPTEDGLGTIVWNESGFDILFDFEVIQFNDMNLDIQTTDQNKFYDIADQTQHLQGGGGHDTFVVEGNSADYNWNPTEDGTGYVIWDEKGFDVLHDFEEIQFQDQTVQLDPLAA